MNTQLVKKLLGMKKDLEQIIDAAESDPTLPAGALRELTATEDSLLNALGKFERPQGRIIHPASGRVWKL